MMYFNCGFMPFMPFMGMRMTPTFYTGQPDLGIWSMNPGGLFGNYGGRPQFSTYPEYYSFQDILSCKNASSTFYYNNYFLNAFMSMLNGNSYAAIQQQQINNAAYETGASIGNNMVVDSGIQAVSKTVGSIKHQLDCDLKNSQLKEEQKQEFESLKQQAEALEERIKQLAKDKESGSKTADQIQAELRSINSSCMEIINKREELVKKINEAATAAAGQTTISTTTADGTASGAVVGALAGANIGNDVNQHTGAADDTKPVAENKPVTDQENKTAPYKARFTCKIGTTCSGVACAVFVDKRGQTHYATVRTGSSWDETNAKNDLINRINAVFKNAGFTNVTLYYDAKTDGLEHPEISDEENLNAKYTAKGRIYREKLAGTGYGAVTFVDKKGNLQTFVARSGFNCKTGATELLTNDLNDQIKAAGYKNVTISADTVNYWP